MLGVGPVGPVVTDVVCEIARILAGIVVGVQSSVCVRARSHALEVLENEAVCALHTLVISSSIALLTVRGTAWKESVSSNLLKAVA